MIDLQAAGGSGGKSDSFNLPEALGIVMSQYHAGGGGGGSGAFATITFDASSSSTLSIESYPASYLIARVSGGRDYLSVYNGKDGKAGFIHSQLLDLSTAVYTALAGDAGAGGEVKVVPMEGSSKDPKVSKYDFGYLVDFMNGASGSKGATSSGTWSAQKKNGAGPSADLSSHQMFCSPAAGGVMTCTQTNSTSSTIVGYGETVTQFDSTHDEGCFAGGGGGGPSLMTNGGTHSTAVDANGIPLPPGIGAGGFGASAWAASRGDRGTAPGCPGGAAAIWIYYCPL
jgi:hypothetical protein